MIVAGREVVVDLAGRLGDQDVVCRS